MRTPVLAVVLAVGTCQPAEQPPCPEAPLATAELHAVTRTATASVGLLGDAFDDLGVEPAAFRKLNAKAEEGYQPWDLDDDETVVSNPLYEEHGTSGENPLFEGKGDLMVTPLSDLGGMGGATADTFAAQRDRAAAWQGVFAGVLAADQDDPAWDAPGVRAALELARFDLGATRCVLATLAAGSDEGLDACTAGADVVATITLLRALDEVATALAAELTTRHDALGDVRDAAATWREAVVATYGKGAPVDAADALLAEVDTVIAATDPTTAGVGNLPAVLARGVPALDEADRAVRAAVRDATLHTAAHEAAHVVQQRLADVEALWADGADDPSCLGEDLGCAISSFRAKVHSLHRGRDLPSIVEAAKTSLALADKEPVLAAGDALRTAIQTAQAAGYATDPYVETTQRQLQTISNVLKTRHDTAKNSVGNIR